MWIEYDFCFKNEMGGREIEERGMMNCDHISSIEIERHGGGYGKAVEVYYHNRYESKNIFILDNEELLSVLWNALIDALKGKETVFADDCGFVRPLMSM